MKVKQSLSELGELFFILFHRVLFFHFHYIVKYLYIWLLLPVGYFPVSL